MTKDMNPVTSFEELEKLNAQVDVWIDDEEYDSVCDDNAIKLNNNAKSRVNKCFAFHNNNYSTHDKNIEWQHALDYGRRALPVIKAGGKQLDELEAPFAQAWSHLFYAKLLRAKIQKRGDSDCCTRRLDDVAAYLERHLPQQNGQDEWETRLTLMYLMELSAVSQDWESLGFSERAQRVITDARYSLECKDKDEEACKKAPYEFYDLWARYNIGVAYFHQGYYRKAVLEFNRIIWQVEKWKKDGSESKNEENLNFFEDQDHHGVALLYLPAILYRAEVQLKLQFAYHSLDTLYKRFWNKKDEKISVKKKRTPQKEIRAKLIKSQAYLQLGRLGESRDALIDALSHVKYKSKLGSRVEGKIIPTFNRKYHCYPNSQERFIDILIADHLDWLKLEGEGERTNQKDDLELRYIVKHGRTKKGDIATAEDYKKAVDAAEPYLKNLTKVCATYFNVVKHHDYNRSGYFQQVAKYLGWLAKAADFKIKGCTEDTKLIEAREKVSTIAKQLYEKAKKDGILKKEPGLDDNEGNASAPQCRYCDAKGIDLRRIEAEHYTWFTDDMLKFFNSESIKKKINPQQLKGDKERFVRRLIKLEWKERDDLRIRDLKLRYQSDVVLDKLRDDYLDKCWEGSTHRSGFAGLLKCADGEDEEKRGDLLPVDHYEHIMRQWDNLFLRHLRSPSIHELQEGGFYFLGLQRWNSASPAQGRSVGGGYLLYHTKNGCVDMGIAIDPGFDFVRNLFHMGFSLDDIDIVLLSHAHLDHIRDFESIVMLLSELEKRGQRQKRVHVILSLGTYKRLEHIVEDPGFRYFMEPYIIDVEREINDDYFEKKMQVFSFRPITNGEHGNLTNMERLRAVLPEEKEQHYNGFQVTITPTRAYHDDKTRSDSFGFLVELAEKVKETGREDKYEVKLAFGYTGDTKWVYPKVPDLIRESHKERIIKDIMEQYHNCDVLLVHLGSLIDKNNEGEWSFDYYNQCVVKGEEERCEKLVREKDHPYLVGMLRLFSSLCRGLKRDKSKGIPLVLLSEFGEELRGGIRVDLIHRLQQAYENLAFLPVDVGMNVQLWRKPNEGSGEEGVGNGHKVWCVQCDEFVPIEESNFERYGKDEALFCVCKTCRKATPLNVLQDRLRHLYEVGCELRTD